MTEHRLNDDICRCMDDGCPERESCLRWLCREDRPMLSSFTASFRDEGEPCRWQIPPVKCAVVALNVVDVNPIRATLSADSVNVDKWGR